MLPGVGGRCLLVSCLALAACSEGGEAAPGSSGAPGTGLDVPEAGAVPYERVVFVTIDTLCADHLASYGYFRRTSPFLDELAERGVLFEAAMSASSHTAPSHASMFTGLPPGLHGLLTNGSQLPAEVTTTAEAFSSLGFDTAAFTSVEFLGGVADGFGHVRAKTSAAKAISNAAISWIRKDRSSDRFFVWLHYYDPHRWKMLDRVPAEHARAIADATELGPREVYREIAERHDLALPFEPAEWRSGDKGSEEVRTETLEQVLAYIDSYDAQIAYADAEIRRVYDALERLGLDGETLWIVTSDHGEGLGSHGYAGHGWQVYQEQLRVPLVVHATNGSLAPRRVQELVSLTDLLPTLVELYGARLTGELAPWTGSSLVPLLGGNAAFERDPVFAQRRPLRKTGGDGVFALQDERFKYVLRMTAEDEFFDLVRDPYEREGLPLDSEDAALLRARLDRWLAQFAAAGLAPEEGVEAWHDELEKLGYAR